MCCTRKPIRLLVFFCFLLLTQISSVSALAYSTPLSIDVLKVEQEGLKTTAEIPQILVGMSPALIHRNNESLRRIVLDQYTEFIRISLETRALATFPESMKNHLYFRAGYHVARNDGIILSMTQNIQQFTGGAHGMYWRYGYNVDARSGEVLKLPDVFIPGSKWAEILNQRVRAREGLWLQDFKGVGAQSHFFLDDKGLTLYFQLYEIAPYVAGIIFFEFTYEELRDMLRPEYMP